MREIEMGGEEMAEQERVQVAQERQRTEQECQRAEQAEGQIVQIVRNLAQAGMDIEAIAQVTGLTPEEVRSHLRQPSA